MRSKKLSIESIAILAIFSAILFTIGTRAAAQKEKVLHNFNSADGAYPSGNLIFDSAGNLYGTVSGGGVDYSGRAYELTPVDGVWKEEVLADLGPQNSRPCPCSGLTLGAGGSLYGMTYNGGADGYGSVFELTAKTGGGWAESGLRSFYDRGQPSGGGYYPNGGVTINAAGNIYGTTNAGGASNYGTVFELIRNADGTGTEQVLHSFDPNSGGDGSEPAGGVILDASGNVYGTTAVGGAYSAGTVFKLTPVAGGVWAEQALHSFGSGSDGAYPYATLTFDSFGNLYGTTTGGGGGHGAGTVFELSPGEGGVWNEKVVHTFEEGTADGQTPYAPVVIDVEGNLYGTTTLGGVYGYGVALELKPASGGDWTEAVLHNFGHGIDGQNPSGGLVFDLEGNLYGATALGGTEGDGTVFEIKP